MPTQSPEQPQPSGADSCFADALGPLVETALKRSVQNEPEVWAQAFIPILAPAIRMAVASSVHDMVQTLNHLLEQGLSARSWQWRVEAWRTGKPFAEVMLLRTLVYRVEQVLLVDRSSGLLLASVAAPGVCAKDSDLISAMLTAIQEFIRDSFHLESNDSVREIHTGDFSLWVESGPFAVVAAAVRGAAPVEYRQVLRAAVDLIHQELGNQIRNFQGDTQAFAQRSREILEGCLQSQSQAPESPSYWRVWILAALLGSALLFSTGLHIWHAWKWNQALAALQNTPGIEITETRQEHGQHVLEALRDPFAVPVESVLAQKGIPPPEVSVHVHPFFSLDPSLLVRRVRATLHAPESVAVFIDRDVVKLGGAAPHDWIVGARNVAPQLMMAGIREMNTDQIQDRELEALREAIEGERIVFDMGSGAIAPSQTPIINDTVSKLREWIAEDLAIGRVPRVTVIGHADSTGSDTLNSSLSNERARHVMESLVASHLPSGALTGVGAGPYSSSEVATGAAPAQPAQRRNVMFRLTPDSNVPGRETH
jgi:OOP family OmpA-OmpF porin